MISRILVPLDMSQLAEHALMQAAELAERPRATVRLVSAWAPLPPATADLGAGTVAVADAEMRGARQAYLDRMASWLRDGTGLEVETAVRMGAASAVIASEAADWPADVIVMSTHGRTGWSRTWMGSVADAVIRHVAVPVLLVRPVSTDGLPVAHATTRAVLVPVDSTTHGDAALSRAIEVFGVGARYELLHVVSPTIAASEVAELPVALPLRDGIATEEAAREWTRQLEEAAARARHATPGSSVSSRVMVDEAPARAIVGAAAAFDVVAIPTRARGPSRWLLGSVTDEVLRGATTRVLAMPPRAMSPDALPVAPAARVREPVAR